MLYFIRHGQTDANAKMLNCGGEWDIELNDTGREQARAFADANATALDQLDYAFISPMVRAQETASLVLGKRSVSRQTEEGLREWHLGDWSGTPFGSVPNYFEQLLTPPNGEAFDIFQSRVLSTLYNVACHPTQKGLVVAHGGVWFAYAHYVKHQNSHLDNCTLIDLCRDTIKQFKL